MDGETDNTDPDELRDSLLMEAMRGEITPRQAEEMAAARCLGPLTNRPALPRFDPKLKSHWSIVEAVAWIAWRNFEFVREQDPGFCSEWIRWSSCTWREPPTDGTARSARPIARKGWVLEPQRLPTLERLVLLEIIKRAEGNLPPTAVMTVREAQATLWRAASEGSLRAEGFNGEGAVVEIPSGEWSELRLSEKDGREALVDARTGVERYTAIKFRRSDLLRLWPGAAVESVAMPTVVIDKGGRPA